MVKLTLFCRGLIYKILCEEIENMIFQKKEVKLWQETCCRRITIFLTIFHCNVVQALPKI